MRKVLSFVLMSVLLCSITPVWAQPLQPGETEFTAAVIKEQEVTFVVVIVKAEVFNDKTLADKLIDTFSGSFNGLPTVLMIQDEQGKPTYYGRTDIADFLSKVPLENIPWKQYALKQVQRKN